MRIARLRTLAALLLLVTAAPAPAQQILFPDDDISRHWVASMAIGLASPFSARDFSAQWNGRRTFSATVEYFPSADASFGLFATHALFDHTGLNESGDATCMLGVVREQYGGGLNVRVYPVRWAGVGMTLAGIVGAVDVSRDRPIIEADGSVSSLVRLPSSLDLIVGGTFGIETTLFPGTAAALEAGLEATDNQITFNVSVVARASVRMIL